MTWNKEYYQELCNRFGSIVDTLDDRISAISDGTINPVLEGLAIGSAKKYRASVVFYDICSFSKRVQSSKTEVLNNALITLDVMLPLLINIVFDYGGYVEKNTGDGIMAIFGIGEDDAKIADITLNSMTTMNYVITHIVNPYLKKRSIDPVNGRFGADLGEVYISRIGSSKGRSEHEHSFLTVLGPTANIASHINDLALENQIYVGNNIKKYIVDYRQEFFKDVTPSDWKWIYGDDSSKKYYIWHYNAVKTAPKP